MNSNEQAARPTPVLKYVGLGCGALILLGVLFAAGLYGVVRMATSGVEEVVQDFLAAAARGDYEAAHSHFSAPLKQAQPLEAFRAMAEANPGLFDVVDTTFNSRSVDLQTGAELSGSVTLRSGTKMPARFRLVQENEAWKLIAYNIGE